MDLFQAVLLSVVEGITEFLPISSTGHLILTAKLLNIHQTDFTKDFEIVIQLGAVLAIVVLYRNSLYKNLEVWKRIITAFVPTAIIGYVLFNFIKTYLLGNLYLSVFSLLIGGIALIFLELIYKEKDHHADAIEKIPLRNAFLIGVCQSVAIIPGVSRSAATIIGGLFLGTKRRAAVEFSFLLAVPTMFAATGLDIVKADFSYSIIEWIVLLTGFVSSFIVALIVVKWFLKFIQTNTFIGFGIYRIIIAILFYLLIIK